jgi:hypothetical protein
MSFGKPPVSIFNSPGQEGAGPVNADPTQVFGELPIVTGPDVRSTYVAPGSNSNPIPAKPGAAA